MLRIPFRIPRIWTVVGLPILAISFIFRMVWRKAPSAECSDLQMEVDSLTKEVDSLRKQIDILRQDNDMLRNKNNELYKQGAQMMEESGSLENTNDEFSNTRLAERFDGALKKRWIDLCEALGDAFTEIQYLTNLSHVMQSVFKECSLTVEETEKPMLQIAKYANGDHDKVRHALRVVRRPIGQKQSTRECVVRDIVSKVKPDDLFTSHNVPGATVRNIQLFLNDLAEVCWLMCIANPPLKLNFDVKGTDYNCVSHRFMEFATIGNNTYSDGEPGAVYLVAWPSVEREDNSGFLKKGEVIVCR
ncbi:uncharacterized protein LOC127860524 [Dreissena polymorpha]|uniref:uncharacterized protein LOC127860524 n=1 Tax=Dreissena polymorpha TaxID=45954 RepID=UPI0022641EE8|nr:uncharacterized protein LOC127860524 [Dreissena polymorpha]